MSGRFASPPIQMTSFGWRFTRLSIAFISWTVWSESLFVGLYKEAIMTELCLQVIFTATSSQLSLVGA